MTWQDFQDAVAAAGVTGADRIYLVETGYHPDTLEVRYVSPWWQEDAAYIIIRGAAGRLPADARISSCPSPELSKKP